MKESTRKFWHDVAFTTTLTFTLITFFFFGLMSITGDRAGGNTSVFTFYSYNLGKLFCVFLFSLFLGFINRIFLWKKPQVILRVVHLFLSFIAYFFTLILMFYTMFDANSLTTQGVLLNVILFLIFYPGVLLVTSLGRKIFLPKDQQKFKSILD